MSAVEGSERVKFPAIPKTEMEIVQVRTSTGIVQDLHVVRQLKGGEVPTKVVPPKQDLSRECAAALQALPPVERIQSIVKSVSSEKIFSLEKAEDLSKQLHIQFKVLESDRNSLQIRLSRGEDNFDKEVAAFNEKVIEYNKIAAGFQQKFEAEFLDRADRGFYQQEIIEPEEMRRCPIGDRHLSFTVLDHRSKKLGDPVFVFEAGLGSAGTFDGRPIAEAMNKDSCCWVTYDRAGTGRSPARSDTQDGKKLIDQVEEDFDRLLSHLVSNNINTPVVIVAHSLGAIYAQNYTLKHPDKVAGLILIDPASEDDKEGSLRASSIKESQSPLKIPKKFIAVERNGVFTRKKGEGPTPLQPPTKEEVAALVAAEKAPPHIKNFSEIQKNTDWWMSAHQKQDDTFNREQEEFLNTATVLKDAISQREKNFKEIPLLVIEKKDEHGAVVSDDGQEGRYSDWRQDTLRKRFGEDGTYVRSNETDHNLQFLASNFIAEQIRHKQKFSNTVEVEVATIVATIQGGNGSTQAIQKEVKKLQNDHVSLATMMEIATTLARQGDTVKASHFFYHTQFHLDDKTRANSMETIMRQMGEAFLAYGKEHNDPTALDFALMHSLSDEQMMVAKLKLSEICSNTEDPTAQALAEMALKRTAIFDALNPVENICKTSAELEKLKNDNEVVKQAFAQAEAIQALVDEGRSPIMLPSGKIVDITDPEGQSISLHVNLRGNRVHEKDPVIIFEAGLGCFSADWQLVQSALPENKMLTMSYDRAGMGWSGPDSAEPTIERTIENLKTLLDKLDLKPPYIFVGHSFGGMVGQLFTLKYPDDVKGLILVDAGLENVPASLGGPEQPRETAIDHLPAAVRHFIYNRRSLEFGDEVALRAHYAVLRALHNTTMHVELKHYKSAGATLLSSLADSPKNPIKCPMKVITAAHYPDMEGRALDEEEKKDKEIWAAGQKGLLDRGSDSSQIIAENSDHMILHHEPELIAAQIQDLFI